MILLILSFIYPLVSLGQPQRLQDDFFLASNNCTGIRTKVSTKEQSVMPTLTVSFGCKRNDGLSLTCSIVTEQGIIASFEMKGGVENNVATLEGDHHHFKLEGVSEGSGKFSSASNLSFGDDYDLTDTRVCEGIWSYNTILDAWIKQEEQEEKERIIQESKESKPPIDI